MPQQTDIFAPPTKEELSQAQLFAPPTKEELAFDKPKPIPPSGADSAMRGAAKGATMGFADELYGLVGAVANPADRPAKDGTWNTLVDRYEAARDYARAKDEAASKANPKTYAVAELAAGLANPVNRAMLPAEGASLGTALGSGAVTGAISGLGNSTAQNISDMGSDVAWGAGGGAAAAGLGRAAAAGLGKLAPQNLRQLAEEQYAKAAGTTPNPMGKITQLMSAEDEAGPAVAGMARKASDIADAAGAKAKYFDRLAADNPLDVGPTWRPFGGSQFKEIGSDRWLSPDDMEAARAAASKAAAYSDKADAYRELAKSSGAKAAEDATQKSGIGVGSLGFLGAMMHGSHAVKAAVLGAGAGLVKKAVTERGNTIAGNLANAGAQIGEELPQSVGTAAGALNQYLNSGAGAQGFTDMIQDSAGMQQDQRRQAVRQAMQRRAAALSEQGYLLPMP